jgi:hypothetical protein
MRSENPFRAVLSLIQGILHKFYTGKKTCAPSIGYGGLTHVANYYFGNVFLQESNVDDSVMPGLPVMGGTP